MPHCLIFLQLLPRFGGTGDGAKPRKEVSWGWMQEAWAGREEKVCPTEGVEQAPGKAGARWKGVGKPGGD